ISVDNVNIERVSARALCFLLGALIIADWLANIVERDERGFILPGPDLIRDGQRPKGWALGRDPFLLETNVPGIFAVGDVRHGSIKRVASGVREGSVAVQFIHQYLSKVSMVNNSELLRVPAFVDVTVWQIAWVLSRP